MTIEDALKVHSGDMVRDDYGIIEVSGIVIERSLTSDLPMYLKFSGNVIVRNNFKSTMKVDHILHNDVLAHIPIEKRYKFKWKR